MPLTSTLVSTTPRGCRFLPLGSNGYLWHALFLAIDANGLQNLFIRNFADALAASVSDSRNFSSILGVCGPGAGRGTGPPGSFVLEANCVVRSVEQL
jgi:hypothetical protein